MPDPTNRFATRKALILDVSISEGARLLYLLLDDYAGFKGEAWPKQTRLAFELGITDREVRNRLAELIPKWVTIQRRRTYLIYFLPRDRNACSGHDRNTRSDLERPVLYMNQTKGTSAFSTQEQALKELLNPSGRFSAKQMAELRRIANGERW